MANRSTNGPGELLGNPSRGGATETSAANAALFDEDDYDYDSSRRSERGRTQSSNVGHNANGTGGRALLDVRHGEGGVAAGGAADTSSGGTNNVGQQDAEENVYCYCRQVSYGEMIACDAKHCKFEWVSLLPLS